MRPFQFLLLVFALLAASASAQTIRSSIGGTVTDVSRQPLTGAAVTLTDDATNEKRSEVTNARGEFLIPTLTPGGYHLEIEHTGYRKYVQSLTLELDQELRVDVPMLAGNRMQTIEVTAKRAIVKTDS